MGLAESVGPNTWSARRDFEEVLRAMQRIADRQKTLAAHGTFMSDERLPIEVLDLTETTSVEGRVLVHGQDEQTGRSNLMLEGTEAKVHLICLQKRFDNSIEVEDFGDAERLLCHSDHLNAEIGRAHV